MLVARHAPSLPTGITPFLLQPPPPKVPAAADEAALVQRLLARDERALRLLYERYAGSLLAVVLRLVRDEALAQDLMQEGLLKVWLGVGSYDPERGRLFTWMARLCTNHAIDALCSPRQQFHRRNTTLENGLAYGQPATFNPEHIGVRELALRLKPKQRELLYFGGCTQVEAAAQLGIPLATVKTRARAALVALGGWAR